MIIEDKCEIRYRDIEGVRNALATFIQSIEMKGNQYVIQRQVIDDYPDAEYRSVLIDLARGLPKIERLKEDLKLLSLAKCNQIHFHLMDSEGICYYSDVFAFDGEINGTKRYTKEEMRELVNYCKVLRIEIVPEIEFPAHANALTKTYQCLKCQTNVENPSLWTVCLGNEDTYIFFEKLIEEICQMFPCEYIHIGGDEHCFDDVPSLHRHYYWNNCKVCKERMESEGLVNERELFYYGVKRLHKIAKKFGRKIMLWNDALDVSKPVDIPKDCIIQFWRIANKHRGPREGCSYLKLLELGYKVICSPFEYCYIDLEEYANPEKTASFDYKTYENGAVLSKNVIGAEVCAWEYGNPEYSHYNYSFVPSAILLLSKMWNRKDVVFNKSYRKSLTKLIFGFDTPKDYDVFELFGSIMPPRLNTSSSYVNLENELMDEKTLMAHEKVLTNLCFSYNIIYKQKILEMIQKMIFNR